MVGRLARFGVRSFAGEAALARDAVESLGIRCGSIEQPAGTLSGGNQQKVVIGKWLATRPRVLLLDEPTRGIDVGAKREIYDLVFKLARDGLAIVVVSSEMPELLLLADRILVHVGGPAAGMLSRARGERGAHHAARRAGRRQPSGRGMSALALISRTKLYWGLVAIFLIGVLSSPVSSKGNNIFLSYGNLLDVLRQVSITGLIATGMTAVIITGGIDLSVGSLMAICIGGHGDAAHRQGDTPAVYMGLPMAGAGGADRRHRAVRFVFVNLERSRAGGPVGARGAASTPSRGLILPLAVGAALAALASGSCCRRSATKFGVVGRAAGRALRRPVLRRDQRHASSSAGGCSPSS